MGTRVIVYGFSKFYSECSCMVSIFGEVSPPGGGEMLPWVISSI